MEDRDEIGQTIRRAIAQQRVHAGFFEWPDRDVKERGIAEVFLGAATREPGAPFSDLQSREAGQDPPDCEALNSHGQRLAIEVSELVSERSVKAAQRGRLVDTAWSDADLAGAIERRLAAKDGVRLKGGPYAEYVVLLHSDEPEVTPEVVERVLATHTFAKPLQIDRAYVLLSYDPGRGGYPYFRIPW
jgi:hypothetical protein